MWKACEPLWQNRRGWEPLLYSNKRWNAPLLHCWTMHVNINQSWILLKWQMVHDSDLQPLRAKPRFRFQWLTVKCWVNVTAKSQRKWKDTIRLSAASWVSVWKGSPLPPSVNKHAPQSREEREDGENKSVWWRLGKRQHKAKIQRQTMTKGKRSDVSGLFFMVRLETDKRLSMHALTNVANGWRPGGRLRPLSCSQVMI